MPMLLAVLVPKVAGPLRLLGSKVVSEVVAHNTLLLFFPLTLVNF